MTGPDETILRDRFLGWINAEFQRRYNAGFRAGVEAAIKAAELAGPPARRQHVWSAEKRRAQADRMRAMHAQRFRKGLADAG